MLQPVRVRQPACPPSISLLSAPLSIPAVIASQPAAPAAFPSSGHSRGGGSCSPPELLLSPRLLGSPPELSTVLPLEQIDAHVTGDVRTTTSKCRETKSSTSIKNSSFLSYSFSQLLSSLEDSYSESSSGPQLPSPELCHEQSLSSEASSGPGVGSNNDNDNDDDEYILLDLRQELEVEYVVLECECHTTVHYWRPQGPGRPVRCYGTCGRILAAAGSATGTLKLQRTQLLYYFQYRRNKKKNKM